MVGIIQKFKNTHTHTYIYTCMHVYVCGGEGRFRQIFQEVITTVLRFFK